VNAPKSRSEQRERAFAGEPAWRADGVCAGMEILVTSHPPAEDVDPASTRSRTSPSVVVRTPLKYSMRSRGHALGEATEHIHACGDIARLARIVRVVPAVAWSAAARLTVRSSDPL